jgi:hypothetical protein
VLNCYLLIICQASTVDEKTKAVSLFNVMEVVGMTPFEPGGSLPVEVHAHFEIPPEDRGEQFETRLVWVAGDVLHSSERSLKGIGAPATSNERLRVTALSVVLPPSPGAYRLHMEARRVGTESWQRISPHVPFTILDVPPSPPSTGA